MPDLPSSAEVQQQYLNARVRFIETELDLAITFCHIAQTTEEPESRLRNIANAEKASETASASLSNMSVESEVLNRLRRKLRELEFMLQDCKGTS